ncbi:MAG: signal peptidase I [Piscirickettsiaceae bacterium]|nr:signal peptidase I [Piscirickettsiaceae bacterium]
MVTLVIVTGIIWLIDMLFWAPQRANKQKDPLIVEYAKSFFPIILVVLVIRSFIAEPFRIPSASMLPTLHIGDFILVNKFAYGVRLPVINTKILEVSEPERGDVVVFRYPNNPKIDYIKRIVGLPGDKVGYFNKTVYINGEEVARDIKIKDESLLTIAPARSELYYESLGEYGHEILIDPERRLVEGETIVPMGEYFVMGDNRDNSNDSRFWGTVPEGNLVGKAFFIWMSWDWNTGGIVWNRLGDSIN